MRIFWFSMTFKLQQILASLWSWFPYWGRSYMKDLKPFLMKVTTEFWNVLSYLPHKLQLEYKTIFSLATSSFSHFCVIFTSSLFATVQQVDSFTCFVVNVVAAFVLLWMRRDQIRWALEECSLSQSSGAVWKSRWLSWAPIPNKPAVSVDTSTLQQHVLYHYYMENILTSVHVRLPADGARKNTLYYCMIMPFPTKQWLLCPT